MPANVEIKARVDSIDDILPRAQALVEEDEHPQLIHQDDTFFRVPHGRLKLRVFSDGAGELIHYHRPDAEGPKVSDYVITPAADRRLICGRCLAQWPFPPLTCPFCSNDDRTLVTSFATRDGRYRVYACDVCRRYLKAYDGRHASRPVLVMVDTIATLPLDAAAIQRGYSG